MRFLWFHTVGYKNHTVKYISRSAGHIFHNVVQKIFLCIFQNMQGRFHFIFPTHPKYLVRNSWTRQNNVCRPCTSAVR
jgi:hypothetical protein